MTIGIENSNNNVDTITRTEEKDSLKQKILSTFSAVGTMELLNFSSIAFRLIGRLFFLFLMRDIFLVWLF